jgi:outer membrane protein assembly factor BamB
MKTNNVRFYFTLLILSFFVNSAECQLIEWRGPDRGGVYNEPGLLNKWPENGPGLLWETKGMGDGYSSPTVTKDAIYVTGRRDSLDILTALTLSGGKKWEIPYGRAWTVNHTGSRCTPTYYNGKILLISGSGDIACVGSDGKLLWTKNYYRIFDSKPIMFGISESPVVTDNMVIVSPGGKKASMAAFNISNGDLVWQTEPLNEEPQYVNPRLIEYAGKKMIITVMGTHIFAVNVNDGRIIWKVNYAETNGAKGNIRKNHAITPLYRDGQILIANGYGWVALKLKLSADGNSVEKVWENRNFDPQLGGMVMTGNKVIGANHQSNPPDTWICIDWNTGKVLWTEKWYSRGSVIAANDMLILSEEKSGHIGLAKPDDKKLNLVSEFQITKGEGPFWAHPVIRDGKLFIRHGDILMVYNLK